MNKFGNKRGIRKGIRKGIKTAISFIVILAMALPIIVLSGSIAVMAEPTVMVDDFSGTNTTWYARMHERGGVSRMASGTCGEFGAVTNLLQRSGSGAATGYAVYQTADPITNVAVESFLYIADGNAPTNTNARVEISASADGVSYVPVATNVATSGQWEWVKKVVTAAAPDIPADTNYIKIEFGWCDAGSDNWEYLIDKITVSSDEQGGGDPGPGPDPDPEVIEDDLDNWTKTFARDNMSLATDSNAGFRGDGSRAVRASASRAGTITYYLSGPVNTMRIDSYIHDEVTEPDIKVYVSPDNVNWTETNVWTRDRGNNNGWVWIQYDLPPSRMPAGSHYIRIDVGTGFETWQIQLGKVSINTSVPEPVEPPAPTTSILDPLDDNSKVNSMTNNAVFDKSNPQWFGGDASRVARNSGDTASIVYRLNANLYTNVIVDAYSYTAQGDAGGLNGELNGGLNGGLNSELYGELKIFGATAADSGGAAEEYREFYIEAENLGENEFGWTHLRYTAPYIQERLRYIRIDYGFNGSDGSYGGGGAGGVGGINGYNAFQVGQVAINQPYSETKNIELSIDWNEERQIIDGFGASAHDSCSQLFRLPEPQRTNLLKYLFDPEDGLGLSVIRLVIWNDGNDGDSCPSIHPDRDTWQYFYPAGHQYAGEPLDRYQVWLCQEAVKINPDVKVVALPWSPPPWMKTNGVYNNGGALREDCYQEFADMLANYCLKYEELYGVEIYGISMQNEPQNNEPYSSCVWNGAQMVNFLNNYMKPTFADMGVKTLIMGSEASCYNDLGSNYYGTPTGREPGYELLTNALAASNLDIVSGHSYAWEAGRLHSFVQQAQKPIWQTEVCNSNSTFNDTMERSMTHIRNLHNYLADAQASAWLYWRLASGYTVGEAIARINTAANPTSFTPSKLGSAIGNYSKFAAPGSIRIKSDSRPEALLTAYKNPDAGTISIVAVNQTTVPQNVTINFENFAVNGALTPYRTSNTEDLAKLADIAVGEGSVTVELPPLSVTTYVGAAVAAAAAGDGDGDGLGIGGAGGAGCAVGINLAAYKPAYASSNERWGTSNHNIDPSVVYINDDYEYTGWISSSSNNQWAYVDLLDTCEISRIRVAWGSDAARAYTVQASDDATNWTVLETVTNGERYGILDFEADIEARYIRVNATQRLNTGAGYNLRNLQIFAPAGAGGEEPDEPYVSISGPASVVSGAGATAVYTISAYNMPMVHAIDLEFEVDGEFLSSKAFAALNGFEFFSAGSYGTPFYWKQDGNKWIAKAILLNTAGLEGDFGIVNMEFNVLEGVLGTADVTLNSVAISYGGEQIAAIILDGVATTEFLRYYSPYDLNKDGVVDIHDLTYAMQYLTAQEGDYNWDEAKVADLKKDGVIDIEDLIEILANYTIPYYS